MAGHFPGMLASLPRGTRNRLFSHKTRVRDQSPNCCVDRLSPALCRFAEYLLVETLFEASEPRPLSRLSGPVLDNNSLDFIERNLVAAAVVKAGGFGIRVPGHALRDLELSAVGEIGG